VDRQGFGGMAYDHGWVVVHSYESAKLLAHELGHTFGATDLYMNMGGQFQYARALMSNYPVQSISADPSFIMVMRGELGMTDADLNGVIDIAEYPEFPESLAVESSATLVTGRMTLEITTLVNAIENNIKKRVIIDDVVVKIPEFGIDQQVKGHGPRAFSLTKDQVGLLKTRANIDITVHASYSFTNRDFTRKTIEFNKTVTVPLHKSN